MDGSGLILSLGVIALSAVCFRLLYGRKAKLWVQIAAQVALLTVSLLFCGWMYLAGSCGSSFINDVLVAVAMIGIAYFLRLVSLEARARCKRNEDYAAMRRSMLAVGIAGAVYTAAVNTAVTAIFGFGHWLGYQDSPLLLLCVNLLTWLVFYAVTGFFVAVVTILDMKAKEGKTAKWVPYGIVVLVAVMAIALFLMLGQ